MGQTTDEIADHIETKREDLKSNLQELETRVKSATDWRHYYRGHTGAILAVAFGSGLLLASLTKSQGERSFSDEATRSATRHQVHKTFDGIATALVGTAATKFKDILGQLIPGFSDQLAQHETDRGRNTTH